MALRHFTLSSSLCAETIGATWEVRSENNMERVRAMIAPPSYLYEVSSARAPEGFHSVKEEPQRKDFQVDFPFENPTGYKKPTACKLLLEILRQRGFVVVKSRLTRLMMHNQYSDIAT